VKSKKINVIKVEFDTHVDYSETTFYLSEKVVENNTETSQNVLSEETVEKILAAITNNPLITQAELSKMTGLTRRGIEYNLSRLKEKGFIERVGPDKGGYWKVRTEKDL
jgi:ATP-dependent DNA helicase RecG